MGLGSAPGEISSAPDMTNVISEETSSVSSGQFLSKKNKTWSEKEENRSGPENTITGSAPGRGSTVQNLW